MTGHAPVDWSRCIVVYAAVPFVDPRFAVQQLSINLAEHLPVLYVDPPVSRLGALRYPDQRAAVEGPRLSMISPRLACLRPLLPPGKERWGMTALSTWLLRRHVDAALRSLNSRAAVTIVHPPLRPLLRGLRDQRRVFLVTDDYATVGDIVGLSKARLVRGEDSLARDADLIVVTSEVLGEKFRSRGHETLVVPNGCDVSLFAATETSAAAPDVNLRAPVVGFIGFISDRADFALLDAVARRGHSVLLVGPRVPTFAPERLRALCARPNVQWVGDKPHALLPSYLRCIDVAVVPYPDTQLNRASFPLKILEYLAAGRRVVATDLPAVRWLDTDLVRVAPFDPEGFADAIETALAEPNSAERRAERREFAAAHDWAHRADRLAAAVGLPAAPAPATPATQPVR